MKYILNLAIVFLAALNCSGQGGNLVFSDVVLITSSDGTLTVPADETWKVTKILGNATRRVASTVAAGSNWSASQTNPNPCTGAISGSFTTTNITTGSCSDGSQVNINGRRMNIKNDVLFVENVIWIPSGSTVSVTSNTCTGTASANIAAGNIYYFDGNTSNPRCGPYTLASGSITYSPIMSVIKFKIVP